MPQCIVQNIIVLVMLVMTVAAPACATLNGDQRFQAVHYAQSQTAGYYQLDGRPLRGAPLSTQELQRFLDHSETLLAQLDQCQTASSGPLAN